MNIFARVAALFRKPPRQSSEDVLRFVRRQIPQRLRPIVPRQTVASIRKTRKVAEVGR